jgi:tripartite-type tricarboxylate transporter receptor subunit TctC
MRESVNTSKVATCVPDKASRPGRTLRSSSTSRAIACGFAAASWISSLAVAAQSEADSFPNRPVRVIVAFAPGGGSDIITRFVAAKLSEKWKQTVVVDNRPGASGIIGTEYVAKAPKDGYTFGINSVTQTIIPWITAKMPYDLVKDFTPLTLVANVPLIVVTGASPRMSNVRSIADLIAQAKAKPKSINFASGGTGTQGHLAAELFRTAVGIDVVHIPYKGGGPAVNDVVGGQVDFIFANAPEVTGFISANRMRALAVTSAKRLPGLPTVATMGESLPGFEVVQWYAFWGPAGIPRPIVDKLVADIAAVVAQPDIRARFEEMGMEAASSSSQALDKQQRSELVKWGDVVKSLGLAPQ